jgi:hypothetical protein
MSTLHTNFVPHRSQLLANPARQENASDKQIGSNLKQHRNGEAECEQPERSSKHCNRNHPEEKHSDHGPVQQEQHSWRLIWQFWPTSTWIKRQLSFDVLAIGLADLDVSGNTSHLVPRVLHFDCN